MSFPETRMRRLRKSDNIRRLVSSISLSADDFIYPTFVKEALKKKESINSLPGHFRYSLNDIDEIVDKCNNLDIPGILIFGIPKKKDNIGKSAYDKNGIVQKAIRRIKEISNLAVFSDVCLCQYTPKGQCGVLIKNKVDNDKTLKIYEKIALSHAESGADFIAPSGMMDGQVSRIRNILDKNGFSDTGIMSYSAKFSSTFYSPFRDAAESKPQRNERLQYLLNRQTHQMDFHSTEQAMREIELDIEEGADIVMIKPALPYLDIINTAKNKFNVPIAAYQVSGEYAVLKTGILDPMRSIYESLIAIKRAGASIIVTYGALEIAEWLNQINSHRTK